MVQYILLDPNIEDGNLYRCVLVAILCYCKYIQIDVNKNPILSLIPLDTVPLPNA